jgi:hypothetical protein
MMAAILLRRMELPRGIGGGGYLAARKLGSPVIGGTCILRPSSGIL